jgi:hypothetical protein
MNNLANLDDGINKRSTVMVVETKNKQLGKNRGILKPSKAFVETNNLMYYTITYVRCISFCICELVLVLTQSLKIIIFKMKNLSSTRLLKDG